MDYGTIMKESWSSKKSRELFSYEDRQKLLVLSQIKYWVSASSSRSDISRQLIRSFKCPRTETIKAPRLICLGEDLMTFSTNDLSTERLSCSSGGAYRPSVDLTGCFFCSVSRVSRVGSAGCSSEHRILTAAFELPSSSFAVTAATMICFRISRLLADGPGLLGWRWLWQINLRFDDFGDIHFPTTFAGLSQDLSSTHS